MRDSSSENYTIYKIIIVIFNIDYNKPLEFLNRSCGTKKEYGAER